MLIFKAEVRILIDNFDLKYNILEGTMLMSEITGIVLAKQDFGDTVPAHYLNTSY